MSRFTCLCGAVIRDDDEPSVSNFVAYSLPTLNAIESAIADDVSSFISIRDEKGRGNWLRRHFHDDYPTDEPDREVIEDIASRRLNDGFSSLFRCPFCNRLAGSDADSGQWTFFRPEQEGGTP